MASTRQDRQSILETIHTAAQQVRAAGRGSAFDQVPWRSNPMIDRVLHENGYV
jgi:hypothetical protein